VAGALVTGLTGVPASAAVDLSVFADPALRDCVEQALDREKVDSLADIRTLKCRSWDLNTLEGVDHLTGLTEMSISDTQLTTLAGIAFPATLESLSLRRNQIADISRISFPDGLWNLQLDGNPLPTLSGVTFPPNLDVLYLDDVLKDAVHKKPSRVQALVCFFEPGDVWAGCENRRPKLRIKEGSPVIMVGDKISVKVKVIASPGVALSGKVKVHLKWGRVKMSKTIALTPQNNAKYFTVALPRVTRAGEYWVSVDYYQHSGRPRLTGDFELSIDPRAPGHR
jgi:hypothetical protein